MRRGHVLFIIALLVQVGILAAVPARKVHTLLTGTTVLLKVGPYDPYHVMKGYYASLSYEIGRPDLPGAKSLRNGETAYVGLKRTGAGYWEAVKVFRRRPDPESCLDLVIIKGKNKRGRIVYGIETYYIPEEMRVTFNDELRKHRDKAVAEVKVGRTGDAAIKAVVIGDKRYEF